ncbi:MAG: alkaline phosphatase family protein [Microbacteriaceae bacterium]
MSTILPAFAAGERWLADVLTSAFASTSGSENRLQLPRSRRTVVVLVDGLGAENLSAHRAHARTLASLKRTVNVGNFPSTTASALATFATGADPGETGMVGYAVRNPATGAIVNQLSGLDDLDATSWQPIQTVWERVPAAADGTLNKLIVSAERYRGSGLTAAVLRGAPYIGANTHAQRLEQVSAFLSQASSGVVYVYIPELDQAAHQFGVNSDQWVGRLEELDGFVADLLRVIGPKDGVILTADHGVLDVPAVKHRIVPANSDLLRDVTTGGEPRFLHLYSDRDADELAAVWREAEGDVAWVATRDEAINAGWFGVVTVEHRSRIGDVLVTPKGVAVYYDERTATGNSMAMIGQHGGLSRTETHVPIVFGGVFG